MEGRGEGMRKEEEGMKRRRKWMDGGRGEERIEIRQGRGKEIGREEGK